VFWPAATLDVQAGCMNPVKLVLGFVPFIVFTVLSGWVPVGWAAAAGLVAALAVVAVTAGAGSRSCRWCRPGCCW
jgi:hypothetical protein